MNRLARATLSLSGLLAGLALLTAGCRPRSLASVTLLSDPVDIVAVEPVDDQDSPRVDLRIRDRDNEWVIRTRVRTLRSRPLSQPAALRAELGEGIVWQDPYLFVREENDDPEATRARVDHVFKRTDGSLMRLGTLSARTGRPGSQRRADGRFADVYDRLEFNTLTGHALAPTFTLLLQEQGERFVVDVDATWAEGRADWEARLNELQAVAGRPGHLDTPAGLRQARALALFCLSFTRYCGRQAEHQASVAAGRAVLGDLEDVLEEVATVQPGELPPSHDAVLRANPALLNFFKESTENPEEQSEPLIPAPRLL